MPAPNIIFIFADDMGYGDLRCNDPNCRIPTPNLDRLAEHGMRFTDAHASTAVCTPSRYGLLTGRYCWRSRLKSGIVWEFDSPLIEPDRTTVASFLREQGYATHCIGKWHLGWDWPTHDGRPAEQTLPFAQRLAEERTAFAREQVDYRGRIGGGPIDRGFDTYFGVDVPNFPPYTWFIDDRLDPLPTEQKPQTMYGNPGPAAPDWSLEAMIPTFTRHAVERIEQAAQTPDQPFFLYYPLTSPHSPIVPNDAFKGRSGIGAYGDFVCEIDWVVGEILDALQRTGQADDTLIVFTSDNGPEGPVPDDEGVFDRARRTGHFSMGSLRGIKRDAWEGGHRMPFLASWPQTIPAGAVCDQPVSLVDLLATCAEIVDQPLPSRDAGEDSISMLPLLRGRINQPTRDHVIYHSMSGKFAIREREWVCIDAPAGNDSPEPEWFRERIGAAPHEQPAELFNLIDDPKQTHNRYADAPDVAARLREKLRAIQGDQAPSQTEAPGGLGAPPSA